MKANFIPILLTMFFAGLPGLKAGEVSIVEYLEDPGFEASHEAKQQINAPDVKELNGWNAIPAGGNFWTSVSYVDANGTSLGDNREAIKPAEGKSYLRMYTEKSSDWLALRTPMFELKNDSTYVISFKVAVDTQPVMARLDVGLRGAKGDYYGLKSYDLASLEPGWSTVVYRHHYTGPDQPGALQITGRREAAKTAGSLNFDDFKTPTENDVSLIPTEH